MYIVTGATGNTGSVVASQLLAKGQKVRVIGRSAERLQPLAAKGAEPFIADASDAAALVKAFSGAQGVYVVVPPNLKSNDFRAEQGRISDAFAQALARAGVKRAVTLSSIGADKPAGTGPIAGLHELEEKLNRIAGLNVLHLRAAYFMENTLAQAGIIHALGKTAGPLRPDVKVPMIATHDIGLAAAQALLSPDFHGHETRELLGPRDLDYNDVTAIIGKAIEKPDLSYVQLPDEQLRPALQQLGLSANVTGLLLEMAAAINSGHVRALEPRSARNTTPATYEKFVAETLVPVYKGQIRAA
ncbi:MAG TPA: NmrA family NAD(P)-binding protein [Candidatus Angelobacter sp.]